SFDLVLGFFVLHHLYALDDSIAAIARLVKSGGRMVFLEPNPFNPLYYVQMMVTPGMMWRGDGGIVRMRPSLVFRAMKGAGLEQVRMTRFGFFPPFAANQQWGPRLEAVLERVPVWNPFLPFQLFAAERP
ncbi:MAG: methyltransferase domain-containing protein, partial [Dehalococcoidia bacterium]|nr:methyltransferase domain-containing protein [Dehalococcoidia bacterium]